MALFVASTDGTTNFRVGDVQVDIISATLVDAGIGFNEANPQVFAGVTCIPVTYVQNEVGPTPTRINALVNDVGFASPPNIIVVGVDNTFVTSDGFPVSGNGRAFLVNENGNPVTGHITAIYDLTLCGGSGITYDKVGGGDTQATTDDVLYHELSHCFHIATNTIPVDANGNTDFTQEEINATVDQNDMRNVRGLPNRVTTSRRGDCGGGTENCCIVATLSSGSAYSNEIHRFRYIRENMLRRSEVGDDFFKNFFHHYYGFSPEVTRLIGSKPNLSSVIRTRLVLPLLAGVELLIHYSETKGKRLTDFLRRQASREGLQDLHRTEFLLELSLYISLARKYDRKKISSIMDGKGKEFSGFQKLLKYVSQDTIRDEFINWSLVDVIDVWTRNALLLHSDKSEKDIDKEIHRNLSAWIGNMPVTSVWAEFSRLQTEIELEHLGQFIFDARSKKVFAARLEEKHPKYSSTIRRWARMSRRSV